MKCLAATALALIALTTTTHTTAALAGDRAEREAAAREAYRCQINPVECSRLQQDYFKPKGQPPAITNDKNEYDDEYDAASGMLIRYSIAEYYASLRDAHRLRHRERARH